MARQLHQEHHHRRPLGEPTDPIGDSQSLFLAKQLLHQPEGLSVGL